MVLGDFGQLALVLVHDDASCACASFSCVYVEQVQVMALPRVPELVPL